MKKGVILYDGNCGLCNRVMIFIMRRTRRDRFRFLSLQSAEAEKIITTDYRLKTVGDSVVYISGKEVFFHSTAVLKILRDMGGFISLLYAFIIVPVFIRDPVYRFIARHRRILNGNYDYCEPVAGTSVKNN